MAAHQAKSQTRIAYPKRGDVFLVAFDPTVGYEIQKTRPAVVIQNDVSNQYSPITIVAAISSQFSTPPFPREVVIDPIESGLDKVSAVTVNQIRSVDRKRLIKRIGRLDSAAMERVDKALMISIGLVPL